MPPLAPLRVIARSSSTSTLLRTPARTFTSSLTRQSANHGHESPYDQPTGWLFGVKPGEKAEKEGWENIWYWGFYGSFALATVAYAFKPDTRYVYYTWGWTQSDIIGGIARADRWIRNMEE
jgi:hypothetical protein